MKNNKLFSIHEFLDRKIIKICGIKITLTKKHNSIKAENIEWYKQNWENLPSDITEEYRKLMANLDDESCVIISTILNRIKISKKKDFKKEFKPTKREKSLLEDIKTNIKQQILYLGNDTWGLKGYLLSEGMFEPGIFHYNCYTKYLENIEYFKDKDIIDAGAYIGDSSIVLSKLTTKNVYAFEPVLETYKIIEKTIKLNHSENIIPVDSALGAKNEIQPLTGKKSMGASFLNKTDDDIPTKIITLDEFAKQNNLNVGLIKVDVEGFEQELLKGATETIKKDKPTLLISIYHNFNDFFKIKPYIEDLNLGYKFKIRKAVDNDIVRDTMLICEI